MNELESLKVCKFFNSLYEKKMPIIFWIKYITIPAWLNFTKESDYISNYFGKDSYERGNVYCFFTLFFIPLIPLFCRQSVWMDKDWEPLYKREVTIMWKLFNQLFGIVWMFILLMLIWWVAGSFSWWHVHRVRL